MKIFQVNIKRTFILALKNSLKSKRNIIYNNFLIQLFSIIKKRIYNNSPKLICYFEKIFALNIPFKQKYAISSN